MTIDSLPATPTHLAFGGSPATILAAGFSSGLTVAFALPPCGLSGGAFAASGITPAIWVPAAVLDAMKLPGHPLVSPSGEDDVDAAAPVPAQDTTQDNGAGYISVPLTNADGGDADMAPHPSLAPTDSYTPRTTVRRVLLTSAVVRTAYASCPPRAVALDLSSYGFAPAAVSALAVTSAPAVVVGDTAGHVAVWNVRTLVDGTPPGVAPFVHPPASDVVCVGRCYCFDSACTRAAAVPTTRIIRGHVHPRARASIVAADGVPLIPSRGAYFDPRTLATGRVPPTLSCSRLAFLRPAVGALVGLCVASTHDTPDTSLTDGAGLLPSYRLATGAGGRGGSADGGSIAEATPIAYAVPPAAAAWGVATADAAAPTLAATGYRAVATTGSAEGVEGFVSPCAHAGRVTAVTVVNARAPLIVTGGADNAVRVFALPSLQHVTTLGGLLAPPAALDSVVLVPRVHGQVLTVGIMGSAGEVIACGAGAYISSRIAAAAAEACGGHVPVAAPGGPRPMSVPGTNGATAIDPPPATTAASVAELARQLGVVTDALASGFNFAARPREAEDPKAREELVKGTPLVVGTGVGTSPADGHATPDGGPPDAASWHVCALATATAWPPAYPPRIPIPGNEVAIAAVGADRRLHWWTLDVSALVPECVSLHAAALKDIAATPLPGHNIAAATAAARANGFGAAVAWPPNVRPEASPNTEINRERSTAAAAVYASAATSTTIINLPPNEDQLSMLRALMMRYPAVGPYLESGDVPAARPPTAAAAPTAAGAAAEPTGRGVAGGEASTDTPAAARAESPGTTAPAETSAPATPSATAQPDAAAAAAAAAAKAAPPAAAPPAAASTAAPGRSVPVDLARRAVASSKERFDEYCKIVRNGQVKVGTLLLRLPAGAVLAVRGVSAVTPLPLLRAYVALAAGVAVTSVTLLTDDGDGLVPVCPSGSYPVYLPPSITPGGIPLASYGNLPLSAGPWGLEPPATLPQWAVDAAHGGGLTDADGPFTAARVAIAPTGTVAALTATGLSVTLFAGGTALTIASDGASHRYDLASGLCKPLRHVTFDSRVHPGIRPRSKDAQSNVYGPQTEVSTLHNLGHNVAPISTHLEV